MKDPGSDCGCYDPPSAGANGNHETSCLASVIGDSGIYGVSFRNLRQGIPAKTWHGTCGIYLR